MPVNNALTPEGSNALGAAFGYYPQLRRNRQFNDPSASSEMPLQFMRGRFASTMGAIPDLMNLKRSLLPAEAVQALEAYGQIAPEVPYGSQYFQENLPLPPQGPAQQMAGAVGSVVPLSPAEILQTARVARQAALAGGKVAKKGARLVGEELNAAMLGERPNTLLGAVTPQPMFATSPSRLNLEKGIYKPELTMEEMLKVKDIPTVDRVKQSIDLVGEDQFKKMVEAQYKKYNPTDQDQEAMLVESVTLNILGKAQRLPAEYPLAPAGTRYEEFGGKLTYMTPDEFLQRVRPLQLDPESLDNIAALKQHVQSGGKLDPLHIYETGKEDGRHRAYLAKELGIEKIPVALHGKQQDAYSQNEMRKFMRQGR